MLRTRSYAMSIGYWLLAIGFVVPNALHAAPYYPADPDAFSYQWHLEKIEAYEGWSKTQGSSSVLVAVIDTGVDLSHPDLRPNLWKNAQEFLDGKDNDGNIYIDDIAGWDFVDGDNDPSPNVDEPGARQQALHHGTLVAGLIGAVGNNGMGGTGVAWKVKIMPLRALDSKGRGDVGTVGEAIRYAMDKGADIINLSFVGPGFDTQLFVLLKEALKRGILVVAAVGNNETQGGIDLDQSPLYPVCYSGEEGEDVVLGVAATDENDKKSIFSNFGANCVDLVAPGTNMYGTQLYHPGRGFNALFGDGWSGSSMAAPLVSGASALIKALNPAYQAQEIRSILLRAADSVDPANPTLNGKLGKGRLNVRRALELAASGGGADLHLTAGIPYIISASGSGGVPELRMHSSVGVRAGSFLVHDQTFKGGMSLAGGDVDGDASPEVIVGVGRGVLPQVRIFKPDGGPVSSFLAYHPGFRGGVIVGVGDVDGDGKDEIVTGAGPGGGPHVRIFNHIGVPLGDFFAYDKRLRGGVNLVVADLDRDGLHEILVAPGSGNGYRGEIKVFNAKGQLKRQFQAYPTTLTNGVRIGVGDLEGDGSVEIITALAEKAISEVRVYSKEGNWQRAFLAYHEYFKGGVNLAVADLDRDGQAEIITGAGVGGGPHVMVFTGFGRMKHNFFPFDKAFRGGVNVGIIKL